MTTTAKITIEVEKDSGLAHKLFVAQMMGLGTHVRTPDAGGANVLTDAWTIFGVTYTKTRTFASTTPGAACTSETDWMA